MLMAGRIAEEISLGYCGEGDGDDRDEIDVALDDLLSTDASLSKYAARLEKWTRVAVLKNRKIIEGLADSLVRQKTMSADTVDSEILRLRNGAT